MRSRALTRAATFAAAIAVAAATAAAPAPAFAIPGVDTSALAVTELIDQQLAAATECDFHSSVTDGVDSPGIGQAGNVGEWASMTVYVTKTGAGRCPGGLPSGSIINQITVTDQSIATHTVVGRGLNSAAASQSVYYLGVPPITGSTASVAGNAAGVLTFKFEGFLSTAPTVSLFCVIDVWQVEAVRPTEVAATVC